MRIVKIYCFLAFYVWELKLCRTPPKHNNVFANVTEYITMLLTGNNCSTFLIICAHRNVGVNKNPIFVLSVMFFDVCGIISFHFVYFLLFEISFIQWMFYIYFVLSLLQLLTKITVCNFGCICLLLKKKL